MGPVGLMRALVVAAARAEEHQGHQPGADQERQYDAEAERDPAVQADRDLADLLPGPEAGDRGQDQQAEQSDESEGRAHVMSL